MRDSDATLILNLGPLDGGSLATREFAEALAKPCLVVRLEDGDAAVAVKRWLDAVRPATLNVAGPRESKRPGIYAAVTGLLDSVIPRPRDTG